MNDKYQEVISQTISWNLKAQTYREIITLNSDGIDFAHIFAVMNRIKFGNSFTNNNARLIG